MYYTDDHTAYGALNLIGKHQMILHGKEEYVRDEATHINGIEGFSELCQNMAISLSRCTEAILDLYLKEIEFRFNHRKEDIFKILTSIIVKSVPNP